MNWHSSRQHILNDKQVRLFEGRAADMMNTSLPEAMFGFCWDRNSQGTSVCSYKLCPVFWCPLNPPSQKSEVMNLLSSCICITSTSNRIACTLDGPNRQSPIASVQRTRSTLGSHSAVPRGTNVKGMNANRAIRIAAPRTQCL